MYLRTLANHSLFLALTLGAACSTSDLPIDRHDQDLDPSGDETNPADDGRGDEEPATSPCDVVRCAAGTHCEEVEVQCFTTPCNPVAECVPDEPPCDDEEEVSCAVALCPEGTYCDDFDGSAECIPLPSCAAVCCAEGFTCELVEVQCIRAPCPPQPECVPVVNDPCASVRCGDDTVCQVLADGSAACLPRDATTCAATLCMEGTYCDDISGHAECIPLPSCDDVRCEDGTHCELVEVQCIRAPCPPQPICL